MSRERNLVGNVFVFGRVSLCAACDGLTGRLDWNVKRMSTLFNEIIQGTV